MISLGVAAIDMESGEIVQGRKWNLLPLEDLKVDEGTMKWWLSFPAAYEAATSGALPAEYVMPEFKKWVEWVCKETNTVRPVAAAWKPGFDLAFVRYYLFRFCGGDIFGRAGSGLDIKTLAAVALNQPFSETQIATVPESLKGTSAEHNHDALDDAKEQARVLFNARKKLGVVL